MAAPRRNAGAERALDALGNDTRRAMMRLLRDRPLTVGELSSKLPVSRPAVSKHLRLLLEARLVDVEVQGTRHVVRVAPEGFESVRGFLDAFWDEALPRFALVAENLESGGAPRAPRSSSTTTQSSSTSKKNLAARGRGARRRS